MFKSMLSIEHSKTMRQTILWVEIGLLGLMVAGLMVLLFAVTKLPIPGEVDSGEMNQMLDTVTWPGAFTNALSMAGGNGLGSIFIIVLVGALVSQEFSHKTLHLWLSRGVPRITFTLARFLSLLLPALMLTLAALVMGGLVSLFLSLMAHGSLRLERLDVLQLLWSVLRTTYTLFPYAALAFLLATITRSAVAAIGVGLSFALLVENILIQLLALFGGTAAQAAKFLPGMMASVVLQENQALTLGAATGGMEAALPLWGSLLGIALYTLVFIGLAAWSLHRQDLTA